jgi:hypothetical protein
VRMTNPNQKLRVVDDPTIRESYGDKIVTTSFHGGVVIVTAGVMRMMPDRIDEAPKRLPDVHVTARLALSPPAAVELVNAISNVLNAATLAQAVPPGATGGQAQKAS